MNFNEIKKLNEELDKIIDDELDEPIEDVYEPIRRALLDYCEQEDAFLEGYVTIEEILLNHGLQDEFTYSDVEKVAREEGYDVQNGAILDPYI